MSSTFRGHLKKDGFVINKGSVSFPKEEIESKVGTLVRFFVSVLQSSLSFACYKGML